MELQVHHLLVSLGASYDLHDPVTPYSLHHLAFSLRPQEGDTYPLVGLELWLFVRIEGTGDHDLWVDLVGPVDEDSVDEPIATYGPFVVRFGSEIVSVSRAWHLRGVPFPSPGWYEFRLTCAGEVLAVEPIFLEN